MTTDPYERVNRAEREPQKVRELLARMHEVASEYDVELKDTVIK